MKVCIPDDLAIHQRTVARDALGSRGHNVSIGVLEPDAEAILTGGPPITSAVVARLPRLRAVVRFARGRHDISDEAVICRNAGICYSHVAGASQLATAEHTIMLMLVLLRRFLPAAHGMRAGQWQGRALEDQGIADLGDATVGLVGLGNVGLRVARLLKAFGSTVFYNKRRRLAEEEEARLGVSFAELDWLIETVDIVSLHTRRAERTSPILDARRLNLIRVGGIVVNTGDGREIDLPALLEHVRAGRLAAGLDVFPSEPWRSAAAGLDDNLLLTPHVAGRSLGTARRMFQLTAAALDEVMRREPVP